jgi:hypothetical protein
LFPFHEYRGWLNSLPSDHSSRDESLQAHGINQPSFEDVSMKCELIAPSSLFQLAMIEDSTGEKFRAPPATAYTCFLSACAAATSRKPRAVRPHK